MSAALKRIPETESLSEKPRLGKKIAKLRLVWENSKLTSGVQKEKTEVNRKASYGRVHYNYFRYYDPLIGNYLTHDPLGIIPGLMKDPALMLPRQIRRRLGGRSTADLVRAGINHPYGYVSANPLAYIDPFGLAPDCKYYDTRCNDDGGSYYCDAAPELCEKWPPGLRPPGSDEEWVGCVRRCLQREDYRCDPTPGQCSNDGIDTSCNIDIHSECWRECY